MAVKPISVVTHVAGADMGDRLRGLEQTEDDPGLAPHLGEDPARWRWRGTAARWRRPPAAGTRSRCSSLRRRMSHMPAAISSEHQDPAAHHDPEGPVGDPQDRACSCPGRTWPPPRLNLVDALDRPVPAVVGQHREHVGQPDLEDRVAGEVADGEQARSWRRSGCCRCASAAAIFIGCCFSIRRAWLSPKNIVATMARDADDHGQLGRGGEDRVRGVPAACDPAGGAKRSRRGRASWSSRPRR